MIASRAALAALAVSLLAGCERPQGLQRIVLITLDTTRADRLGCYGYTGGETPSLDRLARESTLFERAISPVPVTLPAHSSIFTGLYPAQHGVHYNGTFRLDRSYRTMAELLREAGFRTFAVPSSFAVARRFGLAQGFEDYLDPFDEEGGKKVSLDTERAAEDVAARAIEWLGRHAEGRFFVWLHFYDPHWRYRPPFPFSTRFRDRPYDGEIAYMDREIGKVLDALRADPRAWNRTLLIVAGDHGEGLYDHGEGTHGVLAYQSTLHVPFLIKAPGGRRGSRVADPVSLVDILPTVLGYAGLPSPEGIAGINLQAAVSGGALAPRALYLEALSGALNYGWSSLEGIVRGSYKLIDGVDPELYDLAADPGETASLLPGDRSRADEMRQELNEALAAFRTGREEAEPGEHLDAETIERLASLGYVGIRGSETESGGPDPKKMIYLERELLEAQVAVAKENWAQALELSEYVLQSDPMNRIALSFAARSFLETARAREALEVAERLAHHHPSFEFGHDLLGRSWRALGRPEKVVEAYRAATDLIPKSSLLHFRLILAYLEAGRESTACGGAIEGKARWPSLAQFVLLDARCQARLGDLEGAVSSLREARRLGLDPTPFVEKEADFAPLRRLASYRELVEKPIPPETD